MFCPRCGCNLNGTETFCPECGNVVGNVSEVQYSQVNQDEYPAYVYFMWFLLGLFAALGITLILGRMMMFLFIPFLFFGGRKSRSSMFFIGAMIGSIAQLLLATLL